MAGAFGIRLGLSPIRKRPYRSSIGGGGGRIQSVDGEYHWSACRGWDGLGKRFWLVRACWLPASVVTDRVKMCGCAAPRRGYRLKLAGFRREPSSIPRIHDLSRNRPSRRRAVRSTSGHGRQRNGSGTIERQQRPSPDDPTDRRRQSSPRVAPLAG